MQPPSSAASAQAVRSCFYTSPCLCASPARIIHSPVQSLSPEKAMLTGIVRADKIGPYNSHIIGNVIFVLLYFLWLACKDLGSLIGLVMILGIAGGSFVTLQPPLAVMTATDMRYAGTYVGQSMCRSNCSRLELVYCGEELEAWTVRRESDARFDSWQLNDYCPLMKSTIICSACAWRRRPAAVKGGSNVDAMLMISLHVSRATSLRTLIRRPIGQRHPARPL